MAVQQGRRRPRADSRSKYVSHYDGNAVRKLDRVQEAPPVHRNRSRRKRREAAKRADLEVREPGKIAPFAIAGMLAVCLMVVLVLTQYARLVEVNDSAVYLQNRLTKLQSEETKLITQYEMTYDLQAIEQEFLATGEMIKPQSNQVYMIELTEPDTVEYYQEKGIGSSILSGIQEIFSTIRAYF